MGPSVIYSFNAMLKSHTAEKRQQHYQSHIELYKNEIMFFKSRVRVSDTIALPTRMF